jgi:prepilin-type N-terminal cleavage/methylation domain-containing protein
MKKGFTLIEILIVIAISAIILAIVVNAFYSMVRTQALDRDHSSIASLIDQAKSLSINAKSASQYGVYFASSTASLFKGTSYNPADSANQNYNLDGRVTISGLNLVGSSTDQILFSRLTGYANASGTISISLKDDLINSKIIRVYSTGLVEYK